MPVVSTDGRDLIVNEPAVYETILGIVEDIKEKVSREMGGSVEISSVEYDEGVMIVRDNKNHRRTPVYPSLELEKDVYRLQNYLEGYTDGKLVCGFYVELEDSFLKKYVVSLSYGKNGCFARMYKVL